LKLVYPSSKIEVVNLGLTAVNSYTLRDLFPDILEQKPDLILIYTGHNEYYGALGVGSIESLGTSREMVNLILYLNKYKTVELLRNTIQWGLKLFSNEEKSSGTLMSRMAKDQYIEFGSGDYNNGISQFKENLEDMLRMAQEKNVPVILSTLTSNLKDQSPFISIKSEKYPRADEIFKQAKKELELDNYKKADSLFRFAKDLDGLRFRAPEEFNTVIRSLCSKYKLPFADIDKTFASSSPGNIPGDNIMTDHLHPTLSGYLLMGKLFFEKMKESGVLPASDPVHLSDAEQDSLTRIDFDFTELDSVLAEYKIKLLKNDWPFVYKERQTPNYLLLNPKDATDSIAVQILEDKITWEQAHRRLAAYHLTKRNINAFLKEMDALIAQYPFVAEYYDYVTEVLLKSEDYAKAYEYLKSGYDIKPNAFKAKWLGTINLYNNKLDSAEVFLNESLKLNENDFQVWYNLAGVYVKKNKYKEALEKVNKALSLKSDYPEAAALQRQLQSAVRRKNK
jgi:tetratricopeptide (TPR) repeat protein